MYIKCYTFMYGKTSRYIVDNNFQLGLILPLRGHLEMLRDIFSFHRWSQGNAPGT